jgi:hypothetical protein
MQVFQISYIYSVYVCHIYLWCCTMRISMCERLHRLCITLSLHDAAAAKRNDTALTQLLWLLLVLLYSITLQVSMSLLYS